MSFSCLINTYIYLMTLMFIHQAFVALFYQKRYHRNNHKCSFTCAHVCSSLCRLLMGNVFSHIHCAKQECYWVLGDIEPRSEGISTSWIAAKTYPSQHLRNTPLNSISQLTPLEPVDFKHLKNVKKKKTTILPDRILVKIYKTCLLIYDGIS